MSNDDLTRWQSNKTACHRKPARSNPNLMIYLHAFRRHWLLALGLGLLCAAIAAPAV